MPAEMERRLKKQAKKKGVRDEDAYVYGTIRKTGWKPEREKAIKRRLKKNAK